MIDVVQYSWFSPSHTISSTYPLLLLMWCGTFVLYCIYIHCLFVTLYCYVFLTTGILEKEQEQSVVQGSIDFVKTVVNDSRYKTLLEKAAQTLRIRPHK